MQSNTPNLEGHISELEGMHKVSEGELFKLAQPTVIFSRIDEIEIPEINNAETYPPENHQDTGATPPVNTQTSLPRSHPEETWAASAAPPPHPRVEAGNDALQA